MLWKSLNSKSLSSAVPLVTSSPSLRAPCTHHTHTLTHTHTHTHTLTPSSSIFKIFLLLFSVRCFLLACLRSVSCPCVSCSLLLLLLPSPSPPSLSAPPTPSRPCSWTHTHGERERGREENKYQYQPWSQQTYRTLYTCVYTVALSILGNSIILSTMPMPEAILKLWLQYSLH